MRKLLVLLGLILLPVGVLQAAQPQVPAVPRAAVVGDFDFRTPVDVTNATGGAFDDTWVRVEFNVDQFITNGFIKTSVEDLLAVDPSSTSTQIVGQDTGSTQASWWLHIDSQPDASTRQYNLHTGETSGVTVTRDYGFGLDGVTDSITVTDQANLRITTNLRVDVEGVIPFDIPVAAEDFLVEKSGAYELGIRNTNELFGRITTAGGFDEVTYSPVVVDTSIDVILTYDGATMALYVGGVNVSNQAHAFPGNIDAPLTDVVIGASDYEGTFDRVTIGTFS